MAMRVSILTRRGTLAYAVTEVASRVSKECTLQIILLRQLGLHLVFDTDPVKQQH